MESKNLTKLKETLLKIAPDRKVALAFSAGVDSTILLKVLTLLEFDVLAVTFNTNLTRKMVSISEASEIAENFGALHITLPVDVMSIPNVYENTKERCYYCKSKMFESLRKEAKSRGYSILIDGTNADDLLEYRPGLRAKEENGILSPIALSGISKLELREIGKELGLSIASKPSSPCLLTRFPYNTKVSSEMLEACEAGEQLIKLYGFEACRLRVHGNIARIELSTSKLSEFVTNPKVKSELIPKLLELGFDYITVDALGLRSGSMDI